MQFKRDMKSDPFNKPIIGLDEAGRGPLAGPVVAAAVYFPKPNSQLKKYYQSLSITDSKKLSELKRDNILSVLEIDISKIKKNKVYERQDFSFCIGEVSALKIDKINILQASLKAMEVSMIKLLRAQSIKEAQVLIDGNQLLNFDNKSESFVQKLQLDFKTVIGGDNKYLAIALASIIAKEYRDLYMKKLAVKYPKYDFSKHKGYPTKKHKELIKKYGTLNVHRKTFKGVKEYIKGS